VLSHQFLHLLLHFCGLELHQLTPSGILHIVAFVTLCEAYLRIELHFDLWNYFFHAWLWSGSEVEAMVWAVWISWFDSGRESTHTSTFRCPILRLGGGKNGFF
jgi:hypothetical protein